MAGTPALFAASNSSLAGVKRRRGRGDINCEDEDVGWTNLRTIYTEFSRHAFLCISKRPINHRNHTTTQCCGDTRVSSICDVSPGEQINCWKFNLEYQTYASETRGPSYRTINIIRDILRMIPRDLSISAARYKISECGCAERDYCHA